MPEICKSCGASIEYAAGIQSLKCPYCDTVNEIKKAEDELPINVELIIPLVVTNDDLEKQAYAYMASGKYTPDDMLESSTFIKRDCFYVPAYAFKIDYDATWTASFGYDRQEPYTAYRTVTRNNRSHQEAYTAYRTVTDWRPSNGVDSGIFSVSTYAGNKLNELALGPQDIVPFVVANGKATGFNSSFTQGFGVEKFVVPEVKAYASCKIEINEKIDQKVKTHGQGDHQKDWHWNAKMSHSSTTLLVPICRAVFDYQGVNYEFWTDGIGQGTIRADKLPEDLHRKRLVNLGFAPFTLACLGFASALAVWGFSWSSVFFVGVFGGYAMMRRNAILEYSKTIRASLLTQIHASSNATKELSKEKRDKFALAFQRPEKPFFAKTHKDKTLIPVLSVAAFLITFLSAHFANSDHVEKQDTIQPQTSLNAPQQPVIPAPVVVKPIAQEPAAPVVEASQQTTATDSDQKQLNNQPPVEGQKNDLQQQASTPTQSAEDLMARAIKCENVGDCAGLMIEGIYPRKPEVMSVAATRISELNKAQRGDRKTARILNQKGLDEYRSKNINGAIDLLKQAAVADPADVEIFSNLGFMYLQANRVEDAENALVNALSIDPKRTSTWVPLSEALVLSGNSKGALRALLLGYEFSGNKEKTLNTYIDKSTTAERDAMKPIFTLAVQKIKEGF